MGGLGEGVQGSSCCPGHAEDKAGDEEGVSSRMLVLTDSPPGYEALGP